MKKRTLQTFFLIIIFITVSSVNLNVFPARSSASITRVQGNARGVAKSGSSITINLADSPTEGNLLILAFGGYSASPTLTISSISQTGVSWSIQRACTWSYRRVEIWAGVVGSGASKTITVTLSKSISNGIAIADVCEYSGLATSDFKDQNAYGYGSQTTTASTSTTATTTQADELWVGAIFAEGASSVAQSNPTNGFTLLDGANEGYTYGGASLAYLEKIVSSTGQASSGTTLASKCDYYVSAIVTFKAETETVSIGGFEAPSVVYPDSYFLMNTTIVACNDVSEFVNATVELENGIILKWDAATDTFSEYQDTNGYCTLDATGSFKTQLNSTAYKLSWRIKLSTDFPTGSVDVVDADVYDASGHHESGSQSNLFFFTSYSGWWNTDWQKRKPIFISENSGSTLTDHQIAINVTYDSDMQSDFDDLRFTWLNQTSETEVLCDVWIETKSDGAWAYVWVEVPEIPASDSALLFMYYNNPAASSMSNATATLLFFDDFAGASLDTSKWTEDAVNDITQTVNGYFRFEDAAKSDNTYWIYDETDTGSQHQAKLTLPSGFLIKWRATVSDTSADQMGQGGIAVVASDNTIIYYIGYSDGSGSSIAPSRVVIGESGNLWSSAVSSGDSATFILKRSGETYKAVVDGSTVNTFSSSTAPSKIALTAGAYGGYPYLDYVQIDYVLVAKYVDPEPSISVGEEETRTAPTIGSFEAPSVVYPDTYFYLNATVGHSESIDNLCLLYTSPSPRDLSTSRMPSSA